MMFSKNWLSVYGKKKKINAMCLDVQWKNVDRFDSEFNVAAGFLQLSITTGRNIIACLIPPLLEFWCISCNCMNSENMRKWRITTYCVASNMLVLLLLLNSYALCAFFVSRIFQIFFEWIMFDSYVCVWMCGAVWWIYRTIRILSMKTMHMNIEHTEIPIHIAAVHILPIEISHSHCERICTSRVL